MFSPSQGLNIEKAAPRPQWVLTAHHKQLLADLAFDGDEFVEFVRRRYDGIAVKPRMTRI